MFNFQMQLRQLKQELKVIPEFLSSKCYSCSARYQSWKTANLGISWSYSHLS